ncbi:MAG: type II toxin-antitoxin system HigB family toxin [Acidobacteria bacterium]|nr:type II toxin-antitoxin system HigB family toxin [Acidobacteriota bacterium]
MCGVVWGSGIGLDEDVRTLRTIEREGHQPESDSRVRPATPTLLRRTVFSIHGNHYRLVARVHYKWQQVYILKIMTHAGYVREGI